MSVGAVPKMGAWWSASRCVRRDGHGGLCRLGMHEDAGWWAMHKAMLGVPASTTIVRGPPHPRGVPSRPSTSTCVNPDIDFPGHALLLSSPLRRYTCRKDARVDEDSCSPLTIADGPPYLRPFPCATAWLPSVPHRVASTSRLPGRSPTTRTPAAPQQSLPPQRPCQHASPSLPLAPGSH